MSLTVAPETTNAILEAGGICSRGRRIRADSRERSGIGLVLRPTHLTSVLKPETEPGFIAPFEYPCLSLYDTGITKATVILPVCIRQVLA
jgi:hypothetical protein